MKLLYVVLTKRLQADDSPAEDWRLHSSSENMESQVCCYESLQAKDHSCDKAIIAVNDDCMPLVMGIQRTICKSTIIKMKAESAYSEAVRKAYAEWKNQTPF